MIRRNPVIKPRSDRPRRGLLAQLDVDGNLADVVLLAEGAGGKGGAAVFIPGVTVVERDGQVKRLHEIYTEQGWPAVADSIGRFLGAGFTQSAVLTAEDATAMFESVGELTIDNPDAVIVTKEDGSREPIFQQGEVTLQPDEIVEFMTTTGATEDELNRAFRAQLVWEAWFKKLSEGGEAARPSVPPVGDGDLAVDLSTVVSNMSSSFVSFQPVPLIRVPTTPARRRAGHREDQRPDPEDHPVPELVISWAATEGASPERHPERRPDAPGARPRGRRRRPGDDHGQRRCVRGDRDEGGVPRPLAGRRRSCDRVRARPRGGRRRGDDRCLRRDGDARFGLRPVSADERLSSTDLAQAAAAAADAKGAVDVVILEVGEILGICDLFVIASARNVRQVAAVTEEIEERLWLAHDVKATAVEGLDARRWVLVDYGDVVIHVFLEEERAYYRLERLYSDAPQVEWTADDDGSRPAGRSDTA